MDLISYDKELFLWLNNLGTPTWDLFWMTFTNKLTWIPLYLIFAYLLFKRYGFKGLVLTLVLAGIMIICTDQISHLYKDILIRRLRPCADPDIKPYMRLVKSYCGGRYGFFSGHATNHFAVAIFIGSIFKSKKWFFLLLILWASLVAYSRIYIGVHFPLDILTGSFIGSLFGLLAYRIWETMTHKYIL